jgi:hypothetical protein
MTLAPAPSIRSRRWFTLGTIVAALSCIAALAILVLLPAQYRYERKEYLGPTGESISSFSINAFVVEYRQISEPFDPSKSPGIVNHGFTIVNTVAWAIQSRRLAVVLTFPAILLVIHVIRKDRTFRTQPPSSPLREPDGEP